MIKTIEDLYQYLGKAQNGKLQFWAYPISGQPEEFCFHGSENLVVRLRDNRHFDNLDDFIGYCFQCDREGYAHTEQIEVETVHLKL